MAVTPVVLALSRSGEAVAHRVAAALSAPVHGREERVERADAFFPDALAHARDLFAAGVPVVGVCASGILIRAVAPLLADKTTEPPVVSVSDDGAVVVPLLGGHRGANRLARDIARALEGRAAVTTAGDVALGVSLDEPPEGWKLGTPERAKSAMAALLSGSGARLTGSEAGAAEWLAGLPKGDDVSVEATLGPPSEGALAFHPQRATLGVGCARNCPPEELAELVAATLSETGVAPGALRGVFTLDLKADEPAVLELARRLDAPLRVFGAEELEAETPRLANPSDVVFAEVGCHGVSEAAALAGAGPEAALRVTKRKTERATCAVALAPAPIADLRGRARGRLSVVGIGPGQAAWRTPEASRLIAEAEELVGYGLYIDLLGPLAAGKARSDFPLGGEEDRCRYALERAGEGRNVALVCSGDAGIYAMGALVFELLGREAHGVSDAAKRVEVVCAPGISALQAAAARAGAPLGHDFCAISLSDLLTPREDIQRRIRAAAEGDFIVAFYNPVSKRRRTLLAEAREVLLEHRPADTPVLLATSLGRPEESLRYRRLDELEVDEVDMLTVVLVGSSQSRLARMGEGPRMYTPRGYARKIDGDLAHG
ncbi:precorrin-3B C(17)-methyltransferase [Tranquillimonas alkanivorans]|uniref:Cobalt-precorrin 5A hydrolase / precorrin-3B C17-methyltransferase n=1 Tax=Tranquillimonas alkanivorans TaxID=441119 RepID=A0A1I5KM41_9RHOB|nr:precorrin-3B C(17)-methyltransferase [Tranquillimonas alkanivorans]SFO85977.1 cobalt-precorrin 5A hydrolase / precorrin-3B C17-methyltransferase [Tranquillimonas alkanivorans]